MGGFLGKLKQGKKKRMEAKLKKLIKLLLISCILTNLFLICVYTILGTKFNSQNIYLSIYVFVFLAVSSLLCKMLIGLNRLRLRETKDAWVYLKNEVILKTNELGNI